MSCFHRSASACINFLICASSSLCVYCSSSSTVPLIRSSWFPEAVRLSLQCARCLRLLTPGWKHEDCHQVCSGGDDCGDDDWLIDDWLRSDQDQRPKPANRAAPRFSSHWGGYAKCHAISGFLMFLIVIPNMAMIRGRPLDTQGKQLRPKTLWGPVLTFLTLCYLLQCFWLSGTR